MVFFESIISNNFREGSRILLQTCGLGGLRPNTLIIGYKNHWYETDTKPETNQEYVEIIRDALEMGYGVMICRHFHSIDWKPKRFSRYYLRINSTTRTEGLKNSRLFSEKRTTLTPLLTPNVDQQHELHSKAMNNDNTFTMLNNLNDSPYDSLKSGHISPTKSSNNNTINHSNNITRSSSLKINNNNNNKNNNKNSTKNDNFTMILNLRENKEKIHDDEHDEEDEEEEVEKNNKKIMKKKK